MKKLLIPLILLLIGTGGGVAAGLFLMPPAPDDHDMAALGPCGELPVDDHAAGPTEEEVLAAAAEDGESLNEGFEYVKLANQFVVPIVEGATVVGMVVLSVSLEVPLGQKDHAFEVEPKLRDAFLQVLFDHANTGGFDGVFTATTTMRSLRAALRNAADTAVPDLVRDVLILDIQRQDL